MRKKVTLITGASGEIGDALIRQLLAEGNTNLVSLDIRPLAPEIANQITHIQGDICDKSLLARIISEY